MTTRKRVLLKGELHSSEADLRQEKALLAEGVDVLLLERGRARGEYRPLSGWFFVSIALLSWISESLYHSKGVLVDLAAALDVDVEYTRSDDGVPLANASPAAKAISAGLFYTLVPGSLWIGFLTRSRLAGSLLLFLGLTLPVLVVRLYNTNRPDAPANRDQHIADTIADAGDPGDVVLAIVGAGHLPGVERRLPETVDVEVRPPVYGAWSIRHARAIGLPALKAGFVLFSLYVLGVWVVVKAVALLSPVVVALFA